MSTLVEQLSDKLSQAAEKNGRLENQLAYTKDQLTLSLARISALEGQIALYRAAQQVRESGNQLHSKQAKVSSNPYSFAGGSGSPGSSSASVANVEGASASEPFSSPFSSEEEKSDASEKNDDVAPAA